MGPHRPTSLHHRTHLFGGDKVGAGHWSRFHRFFSHNVWILDATWLPDTLRLLLAASAPAGTIVLVLDDTLWPQTRTRHLRDRHAPRILFSPARHSNSSVGDITGSCLAWSSAAPSGHSPEGVFTLLLRLPPLSQSPRQQQRARRRSDSRHPSHFRPQRRKQVLAGQVLWPMVLGQVTSPVRMAPLHQTRPEPWGLELLLLDRRRFSPTAPLSSPPTVSTAANGACPAHSARSTFISSSRVHPGGRRLFTRRLPGKPTAGLRIRGRKPPQGAHGSPSMH